MKNGQISRNPGCVAGITAILAVVDFVRANGDILVCYAGPKQIATVPANATHDLLCSMGLDLDILRMVREEELAQARECGVAFRRELTDLNNAIEACHAAGEAGVYGLELMHADIEPATLGFELLRAFEPCRVG